MNTNDKLRKVAILRYVWSLSDEEISWLDSYFLLRTDAGKLATAMQHGMSELDIIYKGTIYRTLFTFSGWLQLEAETPLLISTRYSKKLNLAVALIMPAKFNNGISPKILASTSEFPE